MKFDWNNPLFLEPWLGWQNRVRQWRNNRAESAFHLFAVSLLLLITMVFFTSNAVAAAASISKFIMQHAVVSIACVFLLSFFHTFIARRQLQSRWQVHWLHSAPLSNKRVGWWLGSKVFFSRLLYLILFVGVLFVAGDNSISGSVFWKFYSLILCFAALGLALGVFLGARATEISAKPTRRILQTARANLHPWPRLISAWQWREARALHQNVYFARWMAIPLLAVAANSPLLGVIGELIAIICLYLLIETLSHCIGAVFSIFDFFLATPISRPRLAKASIRLPLLLSLVLFVSVFVLLFGLIGMGVIAVILALFSAALALLGLTICLHCSKSKSQARFKFILHATLWIAMLQTFPLALPVLIPGTLFYFFSAIFREPKA